MFTSDFSTRRNAKSHSYELLSICRVTGLALACVSALAAYAQVPDPPQPVPPVFEAPVTFLTYPGHTTGPLGLVIADLVDLEGTGDDGYPDVAVVNAYSPYSVSVFHNTGDWSEPASALTLLGPFTLSHQPYDVKAGDFDGDQDLDLAVTLTLPYEGKVAILYNDGTGQFGNEEEIGLQTIDSHGLVVADLNLDGKQDIAVASCDSEGWYPKVELLWKESDGSWDHEVIHMPPQVEGQGTEIVAGSVVAKPQTSALLDLVLGMYGGYLATLVNRGNGEFDVVLTETGVDTRGVALGRFRAGFSWSDLVLTDQMAEDRAQVYWNNGYGYWNYKRPYLLDLDPDYSYILRGVATGRLNLDTTIDFVLTVNGWQHGEGYPWCPDWIIVFVGCGDGTFVETPYFFQADDSGTGQDPMFVKIADMDQDGFNDLLTSNSGTNNISVLINALEVGPPPPP